MSKVFAEIQVAIRGTSGNKISSRSTSLVEHCICDMGVQSRSLMQRYASMAAASAQESARTFSPRSDPPMDHADPWLSADPHEIPAQYGSPMIGKIYCRLLAYRADPIPTLQNLPKNRTSNNPHAPETFALGQFQTIGKNRNRFKP